MSSYPAPLDRLLTLGRPLLSNHGKRLDDYRQFGLGPEHIPDLIRMASGLELNEGDFDSPEVYGRIHAWRALSQLGGIGVLDALCDLLRQAAEDYDDWFFDDFPDMVIGIGPEALPPLLAYVRNPVHHPPCRSVVVEAIGALVAHHPDRRDETVRALTEILADPTSDREVNGFILAELLNLNAVESAPVIEQVFLADRIDESIAGGWPDACYELGLGPKPSGPPLWTWAKPGGQMSPGGHTPRERANERKARRKRKKQARKRNRKK